MAGHSPRGIEETSGGSLGFCPLNRVANLILSERNVLHRTCIAVHDHLRGEPVDVLVDAIREGIADIHDGALSQLVRSGLNQAAAFGQSEVEFVTLNHLS